MLFLKPSSRPFRLFLLVLLVNFDNFFNGVHKFLDGPALQVF